jgi:hypothetical protein
MLGIPFMNTVPNGATVRALDISLEPGLHACHLGMTSCMPSGHHFMHAMPALWQGLAKWCHRRCAHTGPYHGQGSHGGATGDVHWPSPSKAFEIIY